MTCSRRSVPLAPLLRIGLTAVAARVATASLPRWHAVVHVETVWRRLSDRGLVHNRLDLFGGIVGEFVAVELPKSDLDKLVEQDGLRFGEATVGRMVPGQQIRRWWQHHHPGDVVQLGCLGLEFVAAAHVEAAGRAAAAVGEALDPVALAGIQLREHDPGFVRVLAGHADRLTIRGDLGGVLAGRSKRIGDDFHLEWLWPLGDLIWPGRGGEAGLDHHADLLTLEQLWNLRAEIR